MAPAVSWEALFRDGLLLLRTGHFAEALLCFDRAISINTDSIELLSARATALLQLNRLDDALFAFDSALARFPNHSVSWSNRGNVLVTMRRFDDAVASYERALKIAPGFADAVSNRIYALGMACFARGQFGSAEVLLNEAARVNPESDALCMRGAALLQLNRVDEAVAVLGLAIAGRPGHTEAMSYHATALLRLSRFDEALGEFDAVLTLDGNHAVSWNNRGNTLMALKRFRDALASYETALSIQPDFTGAAENRSKALFVLGQMDRCPEAYIRELFDDYAANYDSSMVDTLGYRGHIHLRTLADMLLPANTRKLRILDLGCGTGLAGSTFNDLCSGGSLHGVDLSPRMITLARERDIYDELFLADLEQMLKGGGPDYDLILAADTMVYFGDLGRIFRGVKKRLVRSGLFIFAVEALDGPGWQQTSQHRFRHGGEYLRREAESAGLVFAGSMDCIIRYELDIPVAGYTVALRDGC